MPGAGPETDVLRADRETVLQATGRVPQNGWDDFKEVLSKVERENWLVELRQTKQRIRKKGLIFA